MSRSVALLGGTFDPLHFGHLRVAMEVKQLLACSEVRLLPCNMPSHRNAPAATAAERLEMLKLAVADEPDLQVDPHEVERGGVSYMVDTLESLREELGASTALILVVGMDSFLTLPSWHQWQRIPDLAHLLVVARPGSQAEHDEVSDALIQARSTESPEDLINSPQGRILVRQLAMLDISASMIRDLVRRGKSPRYLLPDQVLNFINKNNLYQ